MQSLFIVRLLEFVVGLIAFASFAEWFLHRFIMHKPFFGFKYPFKAHALIHHHVFRADETYLAKNREDPRVEKIPMAWWNGVIIVAIGTSIFMGTLCLFQWFSWGWWVLCYLVMISYYGIYERVHWCMHLPKARRIERNGIFFRLNGHHLLHHRYMHKNFNVVLPLADFCLGTLLRRSPVAFAQARGPAVPDVQPLTQSATSEVG